MTFDSDAPVPHTFGVNDKRKAALPRWRLVALATLFVWISAFSLCTVHCALGKNAPFNAGRANDEASSCHGDPAKSHSDSQSSGSFCLTVKSLYSAVADLALHPPLGSAFLQPVFAALSAADLDLVKSAHLLRHSRPPDSLLMPEVYLGPAHLPHGPPNF